jgi:hypothetical protein
LAEARPETVALAKQLRSGLSLRRISAELASRGHVASNGKPYVASHLQQVLKRGLTLSACTSDYSDRIDAKQK